jgi:hypothetical protein
MNAIFAKVVRMLKGDRIAGLTFEMPEKNISTAAFPGTEEPEQIHKGKRRVKETYTNHWDMDYLSRQEVDNLYQDE